MNKFEPDYTLLILIIQISSVLFDNFVNNFQASCERPRNKYGPPPQPQTVVKSKVNLRVLVSRNKEVRILK